MIKSGVVFRRCYHESLIYHSELAVFDLVSYLDNLTAAFVALERSQTHAIIGHIENEGDEEGSHQCVYCLKSRPALSVVEKASIAMAY